MHRAIRWLRDGEPVDLTGARARMEIRTTYGGALIHRLDTDNGGITIDPDHTIRIRIPADASSAWTTLNGVYDLEIVFPNGNVARLIQGQVSVSPEVTTGE